MNDDFLRRLRPMPRAAFVHELKARLDQQPRGGSIVASAPAYLRTLLIALLIGGAAFAVTLLTTRHDSLVTRVSVPAPVVPRADDAPRVAASPPPTSKSVELSPAITRTARDEPSRAPADMASGEKKPRAAEASAAGSTSAAVDEGPSRVIAGMYLPAGAVRWIAGAGGAVPAKLYDAWSRQYRKAGGPEVDYRVTGSGGGLNLLQRRAVMFATVDAPMSATDMTSQALFQLPVVAGGVVPIVHLDGVETARVTLDAATLARIYLGEISRWNDASIVKLNPGLALPATRITLAYRLDPSATTSSFTYYLSQENAGFNGRYGVKAQIEVSPGAATRGEDGMLDFVQRTDGAVGYLDYVYARQREVESIRLINRVGKAVPATPENLLSAVTHAEWATTTGFGPSLFNLPGENTWPMTVVSFAVLQTRGNRPQTAATLQFFDWAYRNGAQTAAQLGYVPIPPAVANVIRESWAVVLAKPPPPPGADQDK